MGWSSREWTGFLLRVAGPLTDAPPSATMRRTVRAAAHVKSRCGLRLPCRLPGAFASRHAPVSPHRRALRRGEGAVGGALRAAVRLLAELRRRAGAAVPGLRPLRERLRPDPVPGLRRGVPARVLVQDAGAVPVVRGEAVGGDGGAAGGGGARADVGHAQWVFVIPKMLRPYFLHHRELLGELARAAWETVLELMRAAVDDGAVRPGMVAVVQTAGDLANWHPHVHALVSRGGWTLGRGVGPGRLRRRALGGAAVSPQGHPAAAGRRAALGGADRASAVVAAHRLFGPQPGAGGARGSAGGGAPGALHHAPADQPRSGCLGWVGTEVQLHD